MSKANGSTMADRRKSDRRNGKPGPRPLARVADMDLSVPRGESASIACKGCHYANPVSNSFYTLSVQNLYCRRCGRMIDRHGKLVSPA